MKFSTRRDCGHCVGDCSYISFRHHQSVLISAFQPPLLHSSKQIRNHPNVSKTSRKSSQNTRRPHARRLHDLPGALLYAEHCNRDSRGGDSSILWPYGRLGMYNHLASGQEKLPSLPTNRFLRTAMSISRARYHESQPIKLEMGLLHCSFLLRHSSGLVVFRDRKGRRRSKGVLWLFRKRICNRICKRIEPEAPASSASKDSKMARSGIVRVTIVSETPVLRLFMDTGSTGSVEPIDPLSRNSDVDISTSVRFPSKSELPIGPRYGELSAIIGKPISSQHSRHCRCINH